MKFDTKLSFNSRETKQKYIADKFQSILSNSVLDVGADEGYIKKFLPNTVNYKGIGLGGKNEDIVSVNLEKEKIPFEDGAFETVMCMDVLEHLENIHDVISELCRVSSKYVLISLPNPVGDFLSHARTQNFKEQQMVKFYGLPTEKPSDRHKWFFSTQEAKHFIKFYASNYGYEISYFDQSGLNVNPVKKALRKALFSALRITFKNKFFEYEDMFGSTMWWVLEKK